MLHEHFELLEKIGFDLLLAGIFFFIGMAIRDILNKSNVPPFGRRIVWLVLFLGCIGFISKGIIQFFWEGAGIG